MKRKKIAIVMCILLLGIMTVLSGCITSVKTMDWENSEIHHNGVKLKGAAPEEINGFPLVKVIFVFGNKSHENITDYKLWLEGDDIINKRKIRDTLYFEAEIPGLDETEIYYFRAAALYAMIDGSNDNWQKGEEISFSLMQGTTEKSIIPKGIIKEELLKK